MIHGYDKTTGHPALADKKVLLIDIDKKLRLGDAEATKEADQVGIAICLIGHVLNATHECAQSGAAAILNLELESARGPEAVHWRGAENAHTPLSESGDLLPQPPGSWLERQVD